MALTTPYYDALRKEVRMRPPEFSDTLYFGGGTPSLTPATVIAELIRMMPLTEEAEITLEANPEDVTDQSLAHWLNLGITRLSLGVQSLETPVLRSMLRIHSAKDALTAIEKAKKAGFMNLNIDLMLGSPNQTVEGFLFGLTQILDFHPQHLSLYLLEIHEGTLMDRMILNRQLVPMNENQQVDSYLQAIKLLKKEGYQHYEVSNFALAGLESRHNLKYWTSAPYYGYGAGACSYYKGKRIENLRGTPEYIEALVAGKPPVHSEAIEDKETEARNAVIFGLRKLEGIDVTMFESMYGFHPLSLFEDKGRFFVQEGFLEEKEGHLRITQSGLLVSNNILSSAY